MRRTSQFATDAQNAFPKKPRNHHKHKQIKHLRFFTKHDSNTIQRQTEPSIVHLADRGARAKRIVALTGIAIEAKN
jgi:hypothetical protein